MPLKKIVAKFVSHGEPAKPLALDIGRIEDANALIMEDDPAAHANPAGILWLDKDVFGVRNRKRINGEGIVAFFFCFEFTLAPCHMNSEFAQRPDFLWFMRSIIIWICSRSSSDKFSSPRKTVVAPAMSLVLPSK